MSCGLSPDLVSDMGELRMKMRSRCGFSLLEVIIGFVLISFILVMVGGTLVTGYSMAEKLNQLPNTYYAAQDTVESRLDELDSLITEKYRIENELLNAAPVPAELSVRLAEINNELSAYENESVSLFGKNVQLYRFDDQYVSSDGSKLNLKAGLANEVKLERPVPIIEKVTIKASGSDVDADLYNAAGMTITATPDYYSKNYEYYYADLYQWYICTGDFHTSGYPGEHEYEELLYGTVFAQYPVNYTLLPSEKNASITISSSYAGKFLVCAVTPLSINGKMGEPVLSNYVYISGMPELSSGSYKLVIEPSITPLNYEADGKVEISSMNSRQPATGKLTTSTSARPYVALDGATTDSSLGASAGGTGNWSRYIRFDSSTKMTSSSLGSGYYGSNYSIIAVAKNRDSAPVNFVFAGTNGAGFLTNTGITDAAGSDTGWQLLTAQLSGSNTLTVGGSNVDIAELIVVSNAGAYDISAISAYLAEKYHID